MRSVILTPLLFAAMFPPPAAPAGITGAALHDGHLITWGRRITRWRLPSLRPSPIPATEVDRGEGGCIVDAASPRWGIVTQEGTPLGRLVLRRAPRFTPEVLDSSVEMHDCLAAQLDGRAGIAVLHRYAQLRFYSPPPAPAQRWPYRELYSIYTPSRQGGLLLAELGLVIGNYWMHPAERGGHWREFAINTWSEDQDSATLRWAQRGAEFIAAQGHVARGARVSRFTAPADVTQLWNEVRLSDGWNLRFPHALAASDAGIVVGENAGPDSRLLLFRDHSAPVEIARTRGTHSAFIAGGRVLAVGGGGPEWFDLQPRR
jgi:hypothetical protein